MAPHQTHLSSFTVPRRRQEACALSCLSSTDPGSCTDAACLCASSAWGPLVLSCIQSTCESETSLDSAYNQLLAYCGSVSTPFTLAVPSYTRTVASVPSGSSAAEPVATSALPSSANAPSATESAANATASKPVNISAIMAGVCSFLLVVAIIIGYLGVKDRLRRQRQQSTAANKPGGGWSAGQALASARTGEMRAAALARKADGGAHSSIYGADTSHFDTAGYADLELEDRRAQARREREKAAEAIRRENLDGLFAAVPTLAHDGALPSAGESSTSSSPPLPPPSSRASSFASSKGKQPAYASSEDENEDEDDPEAQYVTLPSLGMGLAQGERALGTASTYQPGLDTASSAGGAGGEWGRVGSETGVTGANESTTALRGGGEVAP